MKNKYAEELIKLEEEVEILTNKRIEILEKKEEYESVQIIQEYKELVINDEKNYNNLKTLKDKYTTLKQKGCDHPIWYLMNSDIDPYESRAYYTCRCLECGLVLEQRSRDFNNVIKGDYKTIQMEYNKKKSDPSIKAAQLIKKYSNT